MLRQIANRVKGRTKSTDENTSLQEALDLLNGLKGNTRGNIHYHAGFIYIDLGEVAPRDMVDFVANKFRERGNDYSNIRHQVYSGKRSEKHYLDLAYGEITGRFGAIAVRGSPHRNASIDFIVEKQE